MLEAALYNRSQNSHCMKTVQKSVLIWYSAAEMFDLVTDIAQYPAFLPWCDQAEVLSTMPSGVMAKVGIAFAGLKQSFTTQNTHELDQKVTLKLVNGPFSKLDGEWRFIPVGDAAQRACRVELTLRYDFASVALAALVGPVFDKIASSMVDAFVKRAQQVYGGD